MFITWFALYYSENLCNVKGNAFNEFILFFCCRFDLIFLILDPQNEQYDRRLARHLVSLYYRSTEEEEDEYLVINV